ncbi:SH3 domain-containing protein [Novosphingobium sp. BL-8A]|uniref:SH3 domain-containing protein n=1 Tax=Novosphingobium sp. BL-8A TaxID=3127639 RepID=UPI003758482A
MSQRNTFRLRAAACAAAVVTFVGALSAPAMAADDGKVPYWASIDADIANLRVGPGESYKIDWVYRRPHLPVKVIRREGPWRLVEDPDGTQGWMRDLLLSRTRSAMVRAKDVIEMHAEPKSSAAMLWRVEPGVVGLLGECKDGWCSFDVAGHKGFVEQEQLWGAGSL